jgi:hypothetical protein
MPTILHRTPIANFTKQLCWSFLACFTAMTAQASTSAKGARSSNILFSHDITEDTVLRKSVTYVVEGEVHVHTGTKITAEDGVTVLIKNGDFNGKFLKKSALIFDTGSTLDAKRVFFKAADASGHEQKIADNAGVWFLGSFRKASKDGVSAPLPNNRLPSHFHADLISAAYLGSRDPNVPHHRRNRPDDDLHDDIDAISVLGVGDYEWTIDSISSEFSGDDGFDVTNSIITVPSLAVRAPTEDGLNISSSTVTVTRELRVLMGNSTKPQDRELFDLEVDDGPTFIVIARNVAVTLNGLFGADEHKLQSLDLPAPDPRDTEFYSFKGVTRKGQSVIYSIWED